MERTSGTWIVLLLLLALISIDVESKARSNIEEAKSFELLTETVRFELNAGESMSKVRMRVSSRVDAGTVSWTLRDPEGEIRMTGKGAQGRARTDTGDLSPIAGIWTLEMSFENATGEYRFNWQGR